MEVAQVVALLTDTLKADPVVRKQAEATLKQVEAVPGHVVVLFRLSSDPSIECDASLRQSAAIRMKNIIGRGWEGREVVAASLSDDDKSVVRDNLLEAIIIAQPLVRSQLALCLNSIARHDYPNRWPALLPAVCAELEQQRSAQRVFGALSALRVLAKAYEYRRDDARQPSPKRV